MAPNRSEGSKPKYFDPASSVISLPNKTIEQHCYCNICVQDLEHWSSVPPPLSSTETCPLYPSLCLPTFDPNATDQREKKSDPSFYIAIKNSIMPKQHYPYNRSDRQNTKPFDLGICYPLRKHQQIKPNN